VAEIGLWHAMRGSQPTRLLEESIPLEKDYKRYYDSLNTALTSLPNSADLTISDFERCLFNWANTDEGIRWRALRIKKAY